MTARFPLLGLVSLLLAVSSCTRSVSYKPQRRELTVTTVPLLVKEARTLYPFLGAAFAHGGVLEGKEVYAFSPSTLTVVAGDTVHFTFINPEDDEHGFFLPDCTALAGESFVLPDCAVRLAPESRTQATYIARQPGIHPFMCIVAKHVPMMHGELIVLSASAVAE